MTRFNRISFCSIILTLFSISFFLIYYHQFDDWSGDMNQAMTDGKWLAYSRIKGHSGNVEDSRSWNNGRREMVNASSRTSSFPRVLITSNAQKRKAYETARQTALTINDVVEAIEKPLGEQHSTKIIFQATTFHGNWNIRSHSFSPQPGDELFRNCPYKDCRFSQNGDEQLKADAVLFHLRDVGMMNLIIKRQQFQKWILYTMEPPWLELTDMDKLNGLFNWTMTYRQDSDIPLRYGFVGSKDINPSTVSSTKRSKRNVDFLTTKVESISSKSRLAAWIASDCCTQSRREEYIEELRRHSTTVDALGSCGEDFCKPSESAECYRRLADKYYFYLSFENALCKDYVTEKFFNILDQNLVPVVFGGADYANLVPPHSYVDAQDFKSPEALANYLIEVAANQTLYESYFDWKIKWQSFFPPWPCQLCRKLHLDDGSVTVRTSLTKWWTEEAKCQKWTMEKGFTNTADNLMPCYHTHRFKNI